MVFAKICGISLASTSLAVAGPVVAYLTKTNKPEEPSQPITISTEVADTTTGSGPFADADYCYLDSGKMICGPKPETAE